MRRTLPVLIALAFVVSACDSAVDAPIPGDDVAPGFTAEVSGDLDRSLTGAATTSTLGGTGISVEVADGGAVTALLLEADDAADRFAFVGVTEGPLAPGTYTLAGIGSRLGAGDFYVGYTFEVEDGDRPATSVAIADEGTVTITRADEDEIAGSFAFTARAVTGYADGAPELGNLTLEGEFVVDVREFDRGGER
ncbi:MAG: hypothetical protein AAF845_18295 [Bacteroidota bacterium]